MTQEWAAPGLRRGLFGYRKREVDEALAVLAQRARQAEETSDLGAVVGRHLGGLLSRFAETVEAGEREAQEGADAIIAEARARAKEIERQAQQLLDDAREVAAATFEEAGRQYEAHAAAKQVATERVEDALEQLADALASLRAIPDASPFRLAPAAPSTGGEPPAAAPSPEDSNGREPPAPAPAPEPRSPEGSADAGTTRRDPWAHLN